MIPSYPQLVGALTLQDQDWGFPPPWKKARRAATLATRVDSFTSEFARIKAMLLQPEGTSPAKTPPPTPQPWSGRRTFCTPAPPAFILRSWGQRLRRRGLPPRHGTLAQSRSRAPELVPWLAR